MKIHTLVLLAALFVAHGARADDWSATFDLLARQPGQARTAFDYLQRQPMEVKQTAAYHAALARAAYAIDNQLWAARAMMVLTMFLEPTPMPDLGSVKKWLGEKGLEHHRRAREALAKGDERAAAKEYLIAVRCDHAVLGFDDRHLRDVSYTLIDKLVREHATVPEYWGHMAFYSYYFGRLDAARQALEQGIKLQQDPYMRWVYQQGLRRVAREEAEARVRPNTPPQRASASPASRDPVAQAYAEKRQQQSKEELDRVHRTLLQLGAPSAPASPRSAPAPHTGHAAAEPATAQETIRHFQRLRDYLKSDLKSLLAPQSIGVSY